MRIVFKLVKTRFFALIEKIGLLEKLPPGAFDKDWNVDSRLVGTGVRALRCLSAYVFRTAISDKRIVNGGEDSVIFAYTDTRTGAEKRMSLRPGASFYPCCSGSGHLLFFSPPAARFCSGFT